MHDAHPHETAWCPGCGNHDILKAVAQAISHLPPERTLLVSGIGQAAKAPHYLTANVFNGLHGRALPAATGARLANPGLTVIVESGDGCLYGEGGNHFIAAVRRNVNLTVLAHNNGLYGLTKGQPSPTATSVLNARTQPYGIFNEPFHPLAVAVALGAGFAARGFSGEIDHLARLIREAIDYPGFALIDILSPCVSFNKYNTFAWYKERVRPLPPDYDPTDRAAALALADRWDELPIGVLYRGPERPCLEDRFPTLARGPLATQPVPRETLETLQRSFA